MEAEDYEKRKMDYDVGNGNNSTRMIYGGYEGGHVNGTGVSGEWLLGRREKWLKQYSSCHQILLVGEGDFSFSLSLAMAFGVASNILATSLDSYETLLRNYVRAQSNLELLRALGATVLHGVDATKMKHHVQINYKKFDRIIFNFPHAGFYGKEDNPHMIEMHKDLLRGFFSNARWLLQHLGQIHVSHKTSAAYSDWNLEELARVNSIFLLEHVPFNIADYPYYQNKRGHGSASDDPFKLGDCCTFIFTVSSPTTNIFNDHSNHLISRDRMSFEHNNTFNSDPFSPKETLMASTYGCSGQLLDTRNSVNNLHVSTRESFPPLKFIVKGSVRLYPSAAGFAGALMGSGNSIIALFSGPVDHFDASVAELLAIRHAILMFERSHLCGKKALIVQCDSRDAISWIKSDIGNPWEVQAVVKETRMALARVRNAEICCSYREHGAETTHQFIDKWVELGFDRKSVTELWC